MILLQKIIEVSPEMLLKLHFSIFMYKMKNPFFILCRSKTLLSIKHFARAISLPNKNVEGIWSKLPSTAKKTE